MCLPKLLICVKQPFILLKCDIIIMQYVMIHNTECSYVITTSVCDCAIYCDTAVQTSTRHWTIEDDIKHISCVLSAKEITCHKFCKSRAYGIV